MLAESLAWAPKLLPLLGTALKYGAANLLKPETDPVALAARATAGEFPEFETLEGQLRTWASQAELRESLSLDGGNELDERPYVASFVQSAEFFAAEETQSKAGQILWRFTENLTTELLARRDGLAVLLSQVDRQFASLGDELGHSREALLAKQEEIAQLLGEMRKQDDPNVARAVMDGAYTARLKLAGRLLNAYLIETAEREIAAIRAELADTGASSDVRFELLTAEGNCALKREKWNSACSAFAEARSFRPDDILASLRYVVALAADGKKDEAEPILRAVPAPSVNEDAALSLWILAASLLQEAAGLAQQIADHGDSFGPRAASSAAEHSLRADDFVSATALARKALAAAPDDDAYVWQLARCLYQTAAQQRGLAVLGESLTGSLREAERLFTRAWSAYRAAELPEIRRSILLDRASCHGLLGTPRAALEDANTLLNEFPDDPDVRRLKAASLVQLNRPSEAIELLRGVPDLDPASSVILAEALVQTNESPQAIEQLLPLLANDHPALLAGVAEVIVTTYDRMREATGRELLDALIEAHPGQLELRLVKARRFEESNCLTESEALLVECAAEPLGQLALAEFLCRRGRHVEAVPFYQALVDSPAHRLARMYLVTLVNAKRYDDALVFARRLRSSDPENLTAIEVEAKLLIYSGDIDSGIKCIRDALALDDTRADLRVALFEALVRASRDQEALAELKAFDLAQAENRPDDLLNVASLLASFGDRRAIDFAFRARRVGDDLPRIHLRYLSLMIALERQGFHPEDPVHVVAGSSCELIDETSGRQLNLLIAEDDEELLTERELRRTFPLARQLLGARVGDIVQLDGLLTGAWKVQGIFSKYAYQSRETYRGFIDRFGSDAGMQMMHLNKDDPSEFLEQVNARHSAIDGLLAQYGRGMLPLGLLAARSGASVLELWDVAIQSNGQSFGIYFQSNRADEQNAFAALSKYSGPIALDITALLTIHYLGLVDWITKHFSTVLVAQQILDSLINVKLHLSIEKVLPARAGATGDGRYYLTDENEVEADRLRRVIDEVIATAMKCSVVGVESSLQLAGNKDFDQQIEMLGDASAFAIQLAKERACPLICDDVTVARLTRAAGTPTISTQAVFGQLPNDQWDLHREELTERLCAAGYRNVTLGDKDVAWALYGGMRTEGRAVLRQLRGDTCSDEAAASVLATALYRLWLADPHESWIAGVVDAAVEAALHGRSPTILDRIAQVLESSKMFVRSPSPLLMLIKEAGQRTASSVGPDDAAAP